MAETTKLERWAKLSPVASFLLAASLVYTTWAQKTAVNQQSVQNNSDRIVLLTKQVEQLEKEVAQQDVISNELKNVKEGQTETQHSVERLADELHAWQREERTYHKRQ